MKEQVNLKRTYLNKKIQAQVSIEFSLALIIAILFLVLSCNLFVWLNHNIVQRQIEYEKTRIFAAHPYGEPGKLDFYVTQEPKGPKDPPRNPNYRPLNVFVPGGYNK